MTKRTTQRLLTFLILLIAAYFGVQGAGWQIPGLASTPPFVPVIPSAPTDTAVPADLSDPVPVAHVVDGDTIDVTIDGKSERVRLLGINTPETVDPRKPVQCFGQEASSESKAVLEGATVRLEADTSQGDRDKYDRLLRYVFLENGTNYNLFLIQQGFAYEYTYDWPYKYQTEFKAAQAEAETNKLGLWADNTCAGEK